MNGPHPPDELERMARDHLRIKLERAGVAPDPTKRCRKCGNPVAIVHGAACLKTGEQSSTTYDVPEMAVCWTASCSHVAMRRVGSMNPKLLWQYENIPIEVLLREEPYKSPLLSSSAA